LIKTHPPDNLDVLIESLLLKKPLIEAVREIADLIYDQGYNDGLNVGLGTAFQSTNKKPN
jgi:hypothetical protein